MPESPYARIIETVRTKGIIFGEALKIRGQKYKQTLPENCSKSTQMAIKLRKLSKFFPECMSPNPL